MISWVMVGLSLVAWFVVCSWCEACEHSSWFGHMWDACERWLVLATCVTTVSL
jgi:hypothetical protein